jgi:hypothetical protein
LRHEIHEIRGSLRCGGVRGNDLRTGGCVRRVPGARGHDGLSHRVRSHPRPGPFGTDYSLLLAIAPTYAPEESHILVVTFEWQNSIGGEWFSSPDNAVSVYGGATRLFETGHYIHPDVPARVALHFWGGGPNPINFIVAGTYSHLPVVPTPGALGLAGIGLMVALRRRR